jgi:hypothetical protein
MSICCQDGILIIARIVRCLGLVELLTYFTCCLIQTSEVNFGSYFVPALARENVYVKEEDSEGQGCGSNQSLRTQLPRLDSFCSVVCIYSIQETNFFWAGFL